MLFSAISATRSLVSRTRRIAQRPHCLPAVGGSICRSFADDTATELPATEKKQPSLKVAIVGSGPSGCYTAKYLMSSLEKRGMKGQIDVYDRLPTPYGLVRYGVAPDHPEVKNVQNDFDKMFESHSDNMRFMGNVQIGGADLSLQELRENYNVVVLSYGCQSDRKLGIPGEHLDGVLSAREFVAWYNGT